MKSTVDKVLFKYTIIACRVYVHKKGKNAAK